MKSQDLRSVSGTPRHEKLSRLHNQKHQDEFTNDVMRLQGFCASAEYGTLLVLGSSHETCRAATIGKLAEYEQNLAGTELDWLRIFRSGVVMLGRNARTRGNGVCKFRSNASRTL